MPNDASVDSLNKVGKERRALSEDKLKPVHTSSKKPPKPQKSEFETFDSEFTHKYAQLHKQLDEAQSKLFHEQCKSEALFIELSQMKQSLQHVKADLKAKILENESLKYTVSKNTEKFDDYKQMFRDF